MPNPVKAVPERYHSLTPISIVYKLPPAIIDFYKKKAILAPRKLSACRVLTEKSCMPN